MPQIDDARAGGTGPDDSPPALQDKPGTPGEGAHQPAPEPSAPRPPLPDMPPAGPHAKPELTNEDATPGSGYLPQITPEDEADPAGG
jgi:hypothetical protein